MLTLCRVTKVKAFFLVLVYVLNFDLFEFSVAFWRRVYCAIACGTRGDIAGRIFVNETQEEGLDGGVQIKCQLSVKFWSICQL